MCHSYFGNLEPFNCTFWFDFVNTLSLLGDLERSGLRTKRNVHHGWVPTVLTETNQFLLEQRAQSIESLDVETKYLAQFLVENSSIKAAVALIVSDTPLGAVTYDQEETTMGSIDEALKKIIPAIFEESSAPVRSCSLIFMLAG